MNTFSNIGEQNPFNYWAACHHMVLPPTSMLTATFDAAAIWNKHLTEIRRLEELRQRDEKLDVYDPWSDDDFWDVDGDPWLAP